MPRIPVLSSKRARRPGERRPLEGGTGEAVDWSDLGVKDSSVVSVGGCEHTIIGSDREHRVAQDEPHIAVSQLWEYSQEPIFLKIPPVDRNHLRVCQDCVAVIWLCRSVSSIEAVEARLKQRSDL
jgi:hypothetical protein